MNSIEPDEIEMPDVYDFCLTILQGVNRGVYDIFPDINKKNNIFERVFDLINSLLGARSSDPAVISVLYESINIILINVFMLVPESMEEFSTACSLETQIDGLLTAAYDITNHYVTIDEMGFLKKSFYFVNLIIQIIKFMIENSCDVLSDFVRESEQLVYDIARPLEEGEEPLDLTIFYDPLLNLISRIFVHDGFSDFVISSLEKIIVLALHKNTKGIFDNSEFCNRTRVLIEQISYLLYDDAEDSSVEDGQFYPYVDVFQSGVFSLDIVIYYNYVDNISDVIKTFPFFDGETFLKTFNILINLPNVGSEEWYEAIELFFITLNNLGLEKSLVHEFYVASSPILYQNFASSDDDPAKKVVISDLFYEMVISCLSDGDLLAETLNFFQDFVFGNNIVSEAANNFFLALVEVVSFYPSLCDRFVEFISSTQDYLLSGNYETNFIITYFNLIDRMILNSSSVVEFLLSTPQFLLDLFQSLIENNVGMSADLREIVWYIFIILNALVQFDGAEPFFEFIEERAKFFLSLVVDSTCFVLWIEFAKLVINIKDKIPVDDLVPALMVAWFSNYNDPTNLAACETIIFLDKAFFVLDAPEFESSYCLIVGTVILWSENVDAKQFALIRALPT